MLRYSKYNFLVFDYPDYSDAIVVKKLIISIPLYKFLVLSWLAKNLVNKTRF